jgi:hypothetical protein
VWKFPLQSYPEFLDWIFNQYRKVKGKKCTRYKLNIAAIQIFPPQNQPTFLQALVTPTNNNIVQK